MSLDTAAVPAATEQAASEPAIATHVAGGAGPISVRDAARSVIDWRRKGAAETSQDNAGESADHATPADEPAVEAGAGGESPPGETEATEAAEQQLPFIEPPRS